jgi:type IV pilus assembly protein PilW
MKKPTKHPLYMSGSRRLSWGLSLIEMMISIAIGLLIMLAILAMYSGASAAARTAEAQGRMNEDAHAALTILTQQIRMTGANPKQANRTSAAPRNPVFTANSYAIRGCDGTFSNISAAAATTPQSLTCGGSTTTLPDSIVVSYEADRFNTVPTTAGLATDCTGSALTSVAGTATVVTGATTSIANITYTVADNRFYVRTVTGVASPSLYCKGSNSTIEQPMVENVEDLQFLYGTSPASTASGTVAGYLTASSVETDANADAAGASLATLATSQLRWARVVTVRICVLVRSEQEVATNAASAQYIGCNGSLVSDPPDRRLRRAYQTTVVLRNRLN